MEQRYLTLKRIEEFEKFLISEEKAQNTVEKYLRDVRAFAAWLAAVGTTEATPGTATNAAATDTKGDSPAPGTKTPVTKEAVLAYKAKLKADGYAATSINSMLISLNRLFDFCGWHELKVKTLKTQRRTYSREDEELTRAEYERLVLAARRNGNERLELILQTICGTGIRVSELSFITVEAVRAGEAPVSLKGKTRQVLIVKRLAELLRAYAKKHGIKSGPIFVTRSGRPLSRSNVWREMKALCKSAQVDPSKVFPHNLRHLFARIFYGLKKDITKLADVLGHSSIDTTRIYLISTGAEHRRYLESMRLII